MNKMILNVGDWSKDGHGENHQVNVVCIIPVEDVQNAYKKACDLTDVCFHHSYGDSTMTPMLTEYEEPFISDEAYDKLSAFMPLDEYFEYTTVSEWHEEKWVFKDGDRVALFTEFWFTFVQLGQKFEWSVIPPPKQTHINGFWNDNLNEGFGYGVTGE